MTSTITTPSTSIARTGRAASASRFERTPVSVVAVVAGAAGAAAVFLYAALAEALSVPMAVDGSPIAPSDFSGGVVTCTIVGALLAVVLARWAKRPAQTFLRTTLVLTVVSLVFPFIVTNTEISTRLTLALA